MKNRITLSIIFTFLALLSTSCRTEEMESIQTPPEETLVADSNLAMLMQQTTMNDGSNDNIIDNSNCFNIELPVTVIVNGMEITVNSDDDYDLIESIFDEFDDDDDNLEIMFPVTIILSDFTEIIINDYNDLYAYSDDCNGENELDDDIECLDFVYPITAVIFNPDTEVFTSETLSNDFELYNFIETIEDDDLVSINFPISMILTDGTEISINDFDELETAIELYEDDCDEDDDYDYNDDDCNDCTPNQLETLLASCTNWYVDKLERDDIDYDDAYDGYYFNFLEDGTVSVYWDTTTVYGTWTTSGSGNNITVTIDIPDLPLCNNNWILHEIDQNVGETKVDLRLGEDDRLRYENNNCN